MFLVIEERPEEEELAVEVPEAGVAAVLAGAVVEGVPVDPVVDAFAVFLDLMAVVLEDCAHAAPVLKATAVATERAVTWLRFLDLLDGVMQGSPV